VLDVWLHVYGLGANVYVKVIFKSIIVLCQANETPKDDLINVRNAFLIKEE